MCYGTFVRVTLRRVKLTRPSGLTLLAGALLLLMPLLGAGPKRNSELMRAVQGISQKMLTQTLRELEERRLVVRRDFGEVPPRVEYELTALGRSLARVVNVLDQWVVDNYHQTR